MSRLFTDPDLLTWEAYPSAGDWGLPERPKIVFHCVSDPHRRARFVTHEGDNASAEGKVHSMDEARLLELLASSEEL
jgi:hypothetical protein